MRISDWSSDVCSSDLIRPGAAVSAAGEMLPISHLIHSPFDKHQEVGEIVLFASQATLHELAWSYVRYVLFVLGLEVALMSLAVAWVVYNLIRSEERRVGKECVSKCRTRC